MASQPPQTILLTGASRGLGLEFARQWLESGRRVFALARRPERSDGLQELGAEHGDRLAAVACDVGDPGSIDAARAAVARSTDSLDLLLNNAGVYGGRGLGLDELDFEELHEVFDINTLGPLRVTRAFLPLLRAGRAPKLAHLTSLMGSITDNGSGGSYAYRMSKAALNMASRNLGHELSAAGVPSVVLHPGWVQTDMGGSHAPLAAPESVAGMIRVLDALEPAQSGRFYSWRGEELPW